MLLSYPHNSKSTGGSSVSAKKQSFRSRSKIIHLAVASLIAGHSVSRAWADSATSLSVSSIGVQNLVGNAVARSSTYVVSVASTGETWNPPGGSTAWDNSAANFISGGVQRMYTDGTAVTFGDIGVGSVTIQSMGVSPSSTAFANNGGTYTISGGGILSGSLAKSGAGTLVLAESSNTYSGATTINGGRVVLGTDNALPTKAAVSIGASATLDENGHAQSLGTVTLSGGTLTSGNGTGSISATSIAVNGTSTSTLAGVLSTVNTFGITAGTGTVDLDVEANAVNTTRLSFAGTGTVLLNGDNTNSVGFSFGPGMNVIAGNRNAFGPTVAPGGYYSFGTNLSTDTLMASSALTGSNAIVGNFNLLSNLTLAGNYPIEFAGIILQESSPITLTVNIPTTISGTLELAGNTNGYVEGFTVAGSGNLTLLTHTAISGIFTIADTTMVLGPNASVYAKSGIVLDTSTAPTSLTLMSATDLNSSSPLSVTGGTKYQATIALASGTTSVKTLSVNGFVIPAGVYGPGNNVLRADGLTLTGPADAYLQVLSVVPEPGALACLPLSAMILFRRRRRLGQIAETLTAWS